MYHLILNLSYLKFETFYMFKQASFSVIARYASLKDFFEHLSSNKLHRAYSYNWTWWNRFGITVVSHDIVSNNLICPSDKSATVCGTKGYIKLVAPICGHDQLLTTLVFWAWNMTCLDIVKTRIELLSVLYSFFEINQVIKWIVHNYIWGTLPEKQYLPRKCFITYKTFQIDTFLYG